MRTRFTTTSGVRVAYQTLGKGDLDVVLVPGMASHVELHWCEPNYARFMRDLGRLGRLITFDKRGTGRSNRVSGVPTLEDRLHDLSIRCSSACGRASTLVSSSCRDEARGLAVHVGARVAGTAGPDEVRVSAAVKDLAVGSGIGFVGREKRPLKGLPGEWELFVVDKPSALRQVAATKAEAWFGGYPSPTDFKCGGQGRSPPPPGWRCGCPRAVVR